MRRRTRSGSGRRWRAGAAAASLLAAAALSGCSLLLDFDAPRDAGVPDGGGDAGRTADAAPSSCDAFEPNDDRASATALAPETPLDAGICPAGDVDLFVFTLEAGVDIAATLTFEGGDRAGDLDLALLDDAGAVIDRSNGFGDVETIERSEAAGNRLPAGTYYLSVAGFEATVENDFTIAVVTASP